MKERPILFNSSMVRAMLDGRKTQTRRLVKPQSLVEVYPNGAVTIEGWVPELRSPLGIVGDRLWVRETFRIYNSAAECACYDECKCASMNGKPLYRASDPSPDDDKWTPSIHMKREHSRIDLEITAVRVERLQEITEEDAIKEGVTPTTEGWIGDGHAKACFADLWSSIYGNWDANPWVWVYEFRRNK